MLFLLELNSLISYWILYAVLYSQGLRAPRIVVFVATVEVVVLLSEEIQAKPTPPSVPDTSSAVQGPAPGFRWKTAPVVFRGRGPAAWSAASKSSVQAWAAARASPQNRDA